MVHGKIQAFINKAKTYASGGGKTPHELQTLHTEAVSLSKQISLGVLKEDDKIIEKISSIFFMLLVVLMIFIVFNDITLLVRK